jgi:hypothetical protein
MSTYGATAAWRARDGGVADRVRCCSGPAPCQGRGRAPRSSGGGRRKVPGARMPRDGGLFRASWISTYSTWSCTWQGQDNVDDGWNGSTSGRSRGLGAEAGK